MSEGIVGLAEEPIWETGVNLRRAHKQRVAEWLGGVGAYLENGLHLTELRPWMFASQHLDDQAPHAPDICLTCVRGLFYDLRCHPENRALQ